jgi:hypothetical protein
MRSVNKSKSLSSRSLLPLLPCEPLLPPLQRLLLFPTLLIPPPRLLLTEVCSPHWSAAPRFSSGRCHPKAVTLSVCQEPRGYTCTSFAMATVYQKKNAAAILLTLVVISLTTASLTLPWFFSSITFSKMLANVPSSTLNSTYITYDLFGTRTISLVSNRVANLSHTCTRFQNMASVQVQSYASLQSTSSTSISSIFRLSRTSVIIASLSSVALSAYLLVFSVDSIRDMIVLKLGKAFSRTIPHVLGLVLIVSISLSFLALLGLSAAFKKDHADCDEGPCRSFSGSASSQHNAVVHAMAWAPQAGWYLAMVAAFISLLAVCLVAINRNILIPPNHSESSSGEHDTQPMIELATGSAENPAVHPHSPSRLDPRARAVLLAAVAGSALVIAVIIWACVRQQCAECASRTPQLEDAYVLEGVVESIEMQVQPQPPATWPSFKDGRKFYEQVLASLAVRNRGLGFEFDAKARSERSVARQIWQSLPGCLNSNCSTPEQKPVALLRYRQVVSGSGNGSSDFTLKQTRRFRQVAAALPQCTTNSENAECKAKIEANYYWRGAETFDVAIVWQRSCTLLFHPSSTAQPPVIRNVRDALPFFLSAPVALGADSESSVLYQSNDCYHEREYKVS